MSNLFSEDSAERKKFQVYTGFIKYFPDAIAAVARHSVENNEKHSPGTPVHWNRAKSSDELDALMRHIMEEEWVAVAWRAMAHLQKQIEKDKELNEGGLSI